MNAPASLDLQLDAYTQRATRRKGRKSTAELLGYTAAATGLAFAGGDAIGGIVHTNTQLSVSWNSATATTSANTLSWDINNNGTADVALIAGIPGVPIVGGFAAPAAGNVAFAATTTFGGLQLPNNLPTSHSVGAPGSFLGSSVAIFAGYVFGSTAVGAFLNTTGYTGFVFGDATDPGPLYGWAKIRVDVVGNPGPLSAKLTVFEWAYEDTGAPSTSPVSPRFPPPPPRLLGLGAMGVQGYRRRRDEGLKRLAPALERGSQP